MGPLVPEGGLTTAAAIVEASYDAQLGPWSIHIVNPCGWKLRTSKRSAARHRITNWSGYTTSLPVWLEKDLTRPDPPAGSPFRLAVFSDAAFRFGLTIKVLFKLPLRQPAGLVASLLKMASLNWAVPDCTTLCHRQGGMGPWRHWGAQACRTLAVHPCGVV